MTQPLQTTVRRLGPGDEDVVRTLAEGEPRVGLLADEATIFLAAFQENEPVGFVYGYVLLRMDGAPSMLFIYELGVDAAWRRQGIATRLMAELERIARSRGIVEGFVLTEPDNAAANAFYESLGGQRSDAVLWDYRYAAG
ncbi:MAG TPA: GNAT family N-acetyltransferase [Gaiellaceae bacterium]|nr:GNAT family N-acetyltransferase [Gaiellaceae bacterium]